MQETWFQFPSQEDLLKKEMATYSSILAGKSRRQTSLAGCSPWGLEESERTGWLRSHAGVSPLDVLVMASLCLLVPTWTLLTGSTPTLGLLVLMTDNNSQLPLPLENSPQPNRRLHAQEATTTTTTAELSQRRPTWGHKSLPPTPPHPVPLHLFVA